MGRLLGLRMSILGETLLFGNFCNEYGRWLAVVLPDLWRWMMDHVEEHSNGYTMPIYLTKNRIYTHDKDNRERKSESICNPQPIARCPRL